MLIDSIDLSKEMSYALRHAPWEYELELDDEGWCDIDVLLNSLRLNERWCELQITDLIEVIKKAEKQRHEIKDNKIRALYGHSIQNKIMKIKKQPPAILYHGTAKRFLENIRLKGLQPQNRHYVHLSVDRETAFQVGKRRENSPIILLINAIDAWNSGNKFYEGNEKVRLADFIESRFIDFDINPKPS